MSNPLASRIADLASADSSIRRAGAAEIYRFGRAAADTAVSSWWSNLPLSALLMAPHPEVTVGLAVNRETFARIHTANGSPPFAQVPPDQDAQEFELHFPPSISLDVLTSREPAGSGAIARYLAKFSEGVQQVEFRCSDINRATEILNEQFRVQPVYPQPRLGADGTRINFFLLPTAGSGKILIELYQR
jgi:hypothetical protein